MRNKLNITLDRRAELCVTVRLHHGRSAPITHSRPSFPRTGGEAKILAEPPMLPLASIPRRPACYARVSLPAAGREGAEAVQAKPGVWIMSKSPRRSGPLAPSIFSRGKTLWNRWRRSWRISRWAWTKRVTFFRDRVHGRSPDCCSVPNRENLVFRRLPLEADEVINDLEEKRQRPGCAVWWRSAGVVAIELDAVIREKAWARTAGP